MKTRKRSRKRKSGLTLRQLLQAEMLGNVVRLREYTDKAVTALRTDIDALVTEAVFERDITRRESRSLVVSFDGNWGKEEKQRLLESIMLLRGPAFPFVLKTV